ncbi:MAG: hypothetical protein KDK34_15990, partial [Leptospiraceae bacterium]|nr:hypothetical protein [Leptospiraceae bacterium]
MKIWNTYTGHGGGYLVEVLRRLGIAHVFSVPGAQILSIWDALGNGPHPELIVPAGEWKGAFMAEGYSAVSGLPAIVLNTVGIGAVHELPGMHSAMLTGAPVIFLSPTQPEYKRKRIGRVFQGLNQEAILNEHVQAGFQIGDIGDVVPTLAMAYQTCMGRAGGEHPRRGPVRVDIEFPMLFQRIFSMLPRITERLQKDARLRLSAAPENLYVVSSEFARGANAGVAEELFPDFVVSPLCNGLGSRTYNAAYALGVKFARRTSPVAWVAPVSAVRAAYDLFLLARSHNIPLVFLEGGRERGFKELAELCGAEFRRIGRDLIPSLAVLFRENPDALFVIAGDGITELAADAVSGAQKSVTRSVGRSAGLTRRSATSRKKTSTGAPAKSNIGTDAFVDPEQAKLRKKRSGAKIAGTQTARKTQKKS